MTTERNPKQLEFHALGRREVIGRFDGGRITSDGGGLLLREVDQQLGLFADRTSTATMRATQLRLYFSSSAYELVHGLRRLGLAGTAHSKAQSTTFDVPLADP